VNAPMISTVEMPAPLAAALQTLRQREEQLRGAEAAVAAARESVDAARRRDIEDVALAREAGKADPRAKHEEKAEAALASAEREVEIMAARVAKLRSEYERLSEELRPKWKAAVEESWSKLDTLQRRRARELGTGFEQTQELTNLEVVVRGCAAVDRVSECADIQRACEIGRNLHVLGQIRHVRTAARKNTSVSRIDEAHVGDRLDHFTIGRHASSECVGRMGEGELELRRHGRAFKRRIRKRIKLKADRDRPSRDVVKERERLANLPWNAKALGAIVERRSEVACWPADQPKKGPKLIEQAQQR
jgi:hypothetical protein